MRKISTQNRIVIEAPADWLWSILADRFHDVAAWASTVDAARPNADVTSYPPGAPGGGRVCTVPGFGETDERFTDFDAGRRTFTYSVSADKVPGFVSGVRNTWAVRQVRAGTSEVSATIAADLSGVLGALMGPMLKMKFAGTMRATLEDLRVYAETGQVSSRKRKAAAKVAANHATRAAC